MLLKCWLLSAGIAMFIIAAGIFTYDVFLLIAYQRRGSNFDPERGMSGSASPLAPTPHWRTTVALVMLAWAPLLISAGIVIVSSGTVGTHASQITGSLAGTRHNQMTITRDR
jgi:hypothetical protein